MNFGRGVSISQENDMMIGANWLPAGTEKQFPATSQPVPVDRQVNQAGRTNWQALLSFPGGHDTPENINPVDLGGLGQAIYSWDGNYAVRARMLNHNDSSCNQTIINGDTNTYRPVLNDGGSRIFQSQPIADSDGTGTYTQPSANAGAGIYSMALPNVGGTIPYSYNLANGSNISSSQTLALASGGAICYQGLNGSGGVAYNQAWAEGGSGLNSQAFVNGSDEAYSRITGSGSYSSSNLAIGEADLNSFSLRDLLRAISGPSMDRGNIQAANRSLAMKLSTSEAHSRSIHLANQHLVPKSSASDVLDRSFLTGNGAPVQKAARGKAPDTSVLHASRPQLPNSHSHLKISWGEENSMGMLLAKEDQCSGSSSWKTSNTLLQTPEYGFPIPRQPSFNLNSPPCVEADASSSITNSTPCPPVTPERPKKILNSTVDESSSPNKNQGYIATNGPGENCCELLHNIVESSTGPSSSDNRQNIVSKESDECIDLNKTPKKKQPKKRKHRPKVVVEGKVKKTPKPKVPRDSKENPTGKRKYVWKKNPKVPETDPTDVMKEILDTSFASSTAKSCKRVLNFEGEKSGDMQHDVASQQAVMQPETDPYFTLNLSSQTKQSSTGLNAISGTRVAMQNDQHGLVMKNQQISAVESQQILPENLSVLKMYTLATQTATENLELDTLNVASRAVNKQNTNPSQRSSKHAYVPIPQCIHADEIDQIVIQQQRTQVNMGSSQRQMTENTFQSLTKKLEDSNQAKGSKREYHHTIKQSQAHNVHLLGPSLCQEILHVNGYNNSSNLGKDTSYMQKKRKTENGAYTNMPIMASWEDERRKAEATSYNINRFTSQINHGILNTFFEGSHNHNPQHLANGANKATSDSSIHPTAAGNAMQKQHISIEWPSQTKDMQAKQVNGYTKLLNLTAPTAAAKDELQPPAPVKSQSYSSSGLHKNGSCCAIAAADKQNDHVITHSLSSSRNKLPLQELKENLYKYHQPAIKRRGRPAKKKQSDPIDDIIEQLKLLEINDASIERVVQDENAIVLYKGNSAIILYDIKKRKPRPRVDLDCETERVWKLLMGSEHDAEETDEKRAKWWEEEREVFRGRADSFIARMHLVQGDRRFSPWKGSVVDSVIGVFLTQNVSDHLSSSAFMSLVARFPLQPERNKTSGSNEVCTTVEEPEVCIVNPEDTIKWHEKVSHQKAYNEAFITSPESSDHRRDSPSSGTSETSLVVAPSQRTEEEVMSSQDSMNSSAVQTPVLRSCSGSNSEAEDITVGPKTNKVQGSAPTNNLCMEKPSMVQECQYHINTISNFEESSIIYRKQNSRFKSPNNHPELFKSSSFAYSINSSQSHKQASVVPSSNYQLHITPNSGILEVECLQMLREESMSSWPSAASGNAYSKDANWTREETQHMTESISKTNAQQNGTLSLREAPVEDLNASLRKYPVQQGCKQTGCTTKNNKESCKSHNLERMQTFQMQSIPSRESVKPAEILDKQDTTMHQCPNVPKVTKEKSIVSQRNSTVDKLICLENEVAGSLSREQVHNSNKQSGEATTNNLKPKKEKVEGKKKNETDWDNLRTQVQVNGQKRERNKDTMDSLDYEALRCAHVNEISEAIKERGMNNMLAERIKDFLDRLVRDHGSIDLEWLRDIPPDKAKDYLLSIRGLGLKSVECVRLLTLHQLAFPVDTNVGRIAVRLGWVPLQPLPESLQLHLLELYPMLESIQKYLWPRLCKLDQRTLYELHYQLITFGKVFCTKHKPNCNACPMRGECRHFASAFASARLALPAPEEKSIVSSTSSIVAHTTPVAVINPIVLPALESYLLGKEERDDKKYEPIIEEPATPEPQCIETLESDIEDAICEDPNEIPSIKLNFEEFTLNLQNYMQENMELQEGDMSKALVALDPQAASIPTPKLKNISRLRTEHQVYELPDSHPLLKGMDVREPDDPSPYLFAIWSPGETANSIQPPERRCEFQEQGKLCNEKTCVSCNSIKEANTQTIRGTLLIPCRTAMQGSFPLNGTYFQVNEVFADHDSSINPINVPRAWIWNLPRRTVYFGTSVTSIFRGLTTEGIQYCFWRGFICVRGFDQKSRAPRPLMARLHLSVSKLSKTKNDNE